MAKRKKSRVVETSEAPVEETAAEGAVAVQDAPEAGEQSEAQPETQEAPEKETPASKPDFDPSLYAEKADMTTEAERIKESREVLKHPPEAGTRYFESPEGYIMVGKHDADHVFCRHANGGKGMMIQPRR